MEVIEITDDNVSEYIPYFGEDLSDDIKRVYYNALGVVDENRQAAGALVYELLNSEYEEDNKSRICFVKCADQEAFDLLEEYYTKTSVPEDETVESFYEMTKEVVVKALTEKGFSSETKEDDILSVTLGELAATHLGKKKKLPPHVGSIEDLSILQYRDAIKQILFKGHKGIMEDIPYLPKSWFDNRISACITSGEKNPGLFLIRRTPSGVLIPALFFAYGPGYKRDLLDMLRFTLQEALKIYPPETVVKISRRNVATKALTDKILPDKKGAQIFYGRRKEQ